MGPEEYREALERLFRRRRFGMRPGLEVTRALLDALGHPERTLPAVHITGSKGKGSVAAMVQAILSAHGLRTGLFTSPHLVSYRERIRLDRRLIPPSAVVRGIARIESLAQDLERSGAIDRAPTFFEVTTVLALDWFRAQKADAIVVEVGIGGRLDATNVLETRVGVLTTIELEHTDVLGPTLSAIAGEKVGILHAGVRGLVGELPPEADRVVRAEAARLGVPLWTLGGEVRFDGRSLFEDGQSFSLAAPGHTVDGVHLPLIGRFQPGNAALAFGAAVAFLASTGTAVDASRVRKAFAGLRWPGRLERVSRRPELFYDVAHTPESARAVAQSLAEVSPLADPAESAVVFGCLGGKDVAGILDALAPLARTIVLVPIRSERGLRPEEIRPFAQGRFPRIVIAPSAGEGLGLARAATGTDGFTLVIGSDYLVGELMRVDESEPDLSDPGLGPPPLLAAAAAESPPRDRHR